jgi:hypothetical protein
LIAGRLDPAVFANFDVAVHRRGLTTLLTGRLDHSAPHGLLRYAQLLEIELIAISCGS